MGKKEGKNNIKIMKKIRIWFFNALASKSDAKISIIFIHGTLLDIFLENFSNFLSHQGTNYPFPPTLEPCSRASNHCLAAMTS